jgi:hypothetical protein
VNRQGLREIAEALAARIGGSVEEVEARLGVAPAEAPTPERVAEAALLARLNARYRGAWLVGTREASVMIRVDPSVPSGEVHLADHERRVVGKIVNIHRRGR